MRTTPQTAAQTTMVSAPQIALLSCTTSHLCCVL